MHILFNKIFLRVILEYAYGEFGNLFFVWPIFSFGILLLSLGEIFRQVLCTPQFCICGMIGSYSFSGTVCDDHSAAYLFRDAVWKPIST